MTSKPRQASSPLSGRSSPHSIRIDVVLPLPLGPEEAGQSRHASPAQREIANDVLVPEVLVEAAHVDGGRPGSTDCLRAARPGVGGPATRPAHDPPTVTSTGWPGRSFPASAGAGRASTRNTSLARDSRL